MTVHSYHLNTAKAAVTGLRAGAGAGEIVPFPLRLKVMCVDDNVDAAVSLGTLLELVGAETAVCHDGASALAAADRFCPNVGVLDVNMPGMDGLELARRLRARAGTKPLLLIAVTARGDDRVLQETEAAGFDVYIGKPADPADLLSVMADYVSSVATAGPS